MNKFCNGVREIKPIRESAIANSLVIGALLKSLGCFVSGIPDTVEGNISYSNKWELFDPEKVSEPDDLPDHWRMVWDKHHEPIMRNCIDLRYRYVHCPDDIVPKYPSVPCKGIFAFTDRGIRANGKIKERDLVHIGNEFVEGN